MARRETRSRSPRRGKPHRERVVAAREASLLVDRMGREGDGLGMEAGSDRAVAIPFALPGERVRAAVSGPRGRLLVVEDVSPERVEPSCRHHGRAAALPEAPLPPCGACDLQHWRQEAYETWKRGLLVAALERAGIEAPVDPLVPCLPAARRRLVLSARRTEAGVLLGHSAARSDRIVDMAECVVARPALVDLLPNLRRLLARMLPTGAPARVSLLECENGIDLRVDAEVEPVAFEPPAGVTRLSLGDEVLHERQAPVLRFGEVAVTPPPGAFVQAVEEVERAMGALVTAHLEGCRGALDLFAGSGTFALRLAGSMKVHAVEGEAAPLKALDRAWRNGSRLRPITTERRDLDRRPLQTAELTGLDRSYGRKGMAARFDGLVLDPPRGGAERQVREVVGSGIPRVAAVSCNPVTLARDLRILVDGGYRIERVVPLDQFAFTPHLEVVTLLSL